MTQVIQRIEKKYLLDAKQCTSLLNRIRSYISEDIYPASSIYNLYLDTERFDLIHRSMEKPPFKEKLRIRSYEPILSDEASVFLEIKRKYAATVCKRRMQLRYKDCMAFLNKPNLKTGQIEKELSYTLRQYQVQPRIFWHMIVFPMLVYRSLSFASRLTRIFAAALSSYALRTMRIMKAYFLRICFSWKSRPFAAIRSG